MNERFPLAYLFPLRIMCGVILLLEGWGKLRGGWLHGTPLMGMVGGWLADGVPYHFFLPVVRTAHAHPKIFGMLVTAGELAVGTSMLLGLATRLGALLGAAQLFSIAAASGQRLAPPGNAILLGALMLLFLLAPPGRFLGLDSRLRTRLPRWMV